MIRVKLRTNYNRVKYFFFLNKFVYFCIFFSKFFINLFRFPLEADIPNAKNSTEHSSNDITFGTYLKNKQNNNNNNNNKADLRTIPTIFYKILNNRSEKQNLEAGDIFLNKIQDIVKLYGIEIVNVEAKNYNINTSSKTNIQNSSRNVNDKDQNNNDSKINNNSSNSDNQEEKDRKALYKISSIQSFEGAFFERNLSNEYLHSLFIYAELTKTNPNTIESSKNDSDTVDSNSHNSNIKVKETTERSIEDFLFSSFEMNKFSYAKNIYNSNNFLKNGNAAAEAAEKSLERIKLFFKVRFNKQKMIFDVEKINFKINNKISFIFPDAYDSIIKINENSNYLFFIAKKKNRCIGDLFVANKDRNLWSMSMKNVILSQQKNANENEGEIDAEYFADFIQVFYIGTLNIYRYNMHYLSEITNFLSSNA